MGHLPIAPGAGVVSTALTALMRTYALINGLLVRSINLFNFMDDIDGIAGSVAAFEEAPARAVKWYLSSKGTSGVG